MIVVLATEATQIDWGTIIVQSLITLGVVFGGAGFWSLRQAKFQAKREDKKEEKNYDTKFDTLSNQVTTLSTQITTVSEDIQGLKQDIALLQEANQITVEYRKSRDEQDRISSVERGAVIESLKAMSRDRLLDAYERCMAKGYYTIEERETYGKLYECYHGKPFEGNGVMQQLREKMLALPTTSEEAEHNKTSILGSKTKKDIV